LPLIDTMKKGALPFKACPRENGDWDDIPQPSFPRTRESRIDNLVLDLIGDRNDDGKTILLPPNDISKGHLTPLSTSQGVLLQATFLLRFLTPSQIQ